MAELATITIAACAAVVGGVSLWAALLHRREVVDTAPGIAPTSMPAEPLKPTPPPTTRHRTHADAVRRVATTRHRTHADAVRRVATELRRRGYSVTTLAQFKRGATHDLVADGVTIAVRVSAAQKHDVERAGRRYEYKLLRWNTHRHGVRPETQPDVWVFAEAERGGVAYVVPTSERVPPMTVSLTAEPRRGDRRAWLYAWEERWDVVGAAQQRKNA